MTHERFQSALQRIPYAAYLGICLDSDSGIFTLPFRDDLVGNMHLRAVHGGAIGGFLENAAMIWLSITEDQQRVPKPVDFSLDFLRSAQARDSHAHCEVLRKGRRVAQVQVRCWQDDPQRPVSVGRGHFLLESDLDNASDPAA